VPGAANIAFTPGMVLRTSGREEEAFDCFGGCIRGILNYPGGLLEAFGQPQLSAIVTDP